MISSYNAQWKRIFLDNNLKSIKCILALYHSNFSQKNKNLSSYFNWNNNRGNSLHRDGKAEKPNRGWWGSLEITTAVCRDKEGRQDHQSLRPRPLWWEPDHGGVDQQKGDQEAGSTEWKLRPWRRHVWGRKACLHPSSLNLLPVLHTWSNLPTASLQENLGNEFLAI